MRDLYILAQTVGTNEPWHLELELSAGELKALGSVAAQWAILEHHMNKHMSDVSRIILDSPLPASVENEPFKRRLRLWREIVNKAFAKHPEVKKTVLAVIGRIGSISQERNDLIHGLIQWDESNRKKLKVYNRSNTHGAPWKITKKRIEETAFKISVLNFDLITVHGPPETPFGASPRIRGKPVGLNPQPAGARQNRPQASRIKRKPRKPTSKA